MKEFPPLPRGMHPSKSTLKFVAGMCTTKVELGFKVDGKGS